jgi:protein-disulfide isomerase
MAKGLGINVTQFKKDMESKETEALIKNNMDLADGIDLTATPTFVVKGVSKIISGALPLEDLQKLLKGEA